MILSCQPYREDRNLGRAYNEAFSLIGEDDYLIVTDYDVLYLLPDQLKHITEYTRHYPECDLFVCWANRTFEQNSQIYNGKINENADMRKHLQIAKSVYKNLYNVTRVYQDISGFLMVIPKRTWNEIKFTEDLKCLGVDTLFSQRLLAANKIIYRMDGIYVWHTYRLMDGIKNKLHLL